MTKINKIKQMINLWILWSEEI